MKHALMGLAALAGVLSANPVQSFNLPYSGNKFSVQHNDIFYYTADGKGGKILTSGKSYYLSYGDVSDKVNEFGTVFIRPVEDQFFTLKDSRGMQVCREDRWEYYTSPSAAADGCLRNAPSPAKESASYVISSLSHPDLRAITYYHDGSMHIRFDIKYRFDEKFYYEQLRKLNEK